MSKHESIHLTPTHLLYAFGYSLTSVWATVLLFSSFFSSASNPALITLSMLSGAVACVVALFLHAKIELFSGRNGISSIYATGMAAGTLLCTFPALAGIAPVHDVGLVVSGLFAILLLLTWFEAFSRLPSRIIVALSGCSFLISAMGVFAVLSCPVEVASILISAAPIVSFSLLPKPLSAKPHQYAVRPSLGAVLSEAVSWKTLLGVVISFFVIGAIGTVAPELGASVELHVVYLVIPAVLMGVFLLTAVVAPPHIDGSPLFKLLLVAVAAAAFFLVYYGGTSLSLVFFIYITADVLLWSVLLLAAKKTPVAPHAVFATGWLAECIGNVVGHNVTALMGTTPYLFALVILLILVAVGFAFGDGLFVLDLGDGDDGDSGETTGEEGLPPVGPQLSAEDPEGGEDAPAADKTAEFAAKYGLSSRETDVFALWITGHGLKYIQDALFISESTVKTHLRSIYRKCDTHNRAEIIDLYEN